jgi:hypothetical protein
MAQCDTYMYGGVGECAALRDPIKGIMITDKGTTITPANAKIIGTTDAAGWMAVLAPKVATSTYEKGVLVDFSHGYEVTTAEAEKVTSNLGYVTQVGQQIPRMTGYAKVSYSEYMSFFALNGQVRDIPIIAHNGNLLMTKSGTSYKGFRGTIFVKEGGIPTAGGDLTKECMFDIVFEDPEEWQNIVEVVTDFTFTELKDLCPVGLDVEVTTAYEGTGGTFTIKVTKRATDTPFTGVAAAANVQVVKAVNDATCAISAVAQTNAAIGSYEVTATASLTGPVWARITAESATKRTYVSKMFRIL